MVDGKPHIRPKSAKLASNAVPGERARQIAPGVVYVDFTGGSNPRAKTQDSYQNAMAELGVGQPNQLSAGTYSLNPISRNRTLLDYAYRGSWVCKGAIDAIPDDMTREWIDVVSTMPPDQIEMLAQDQQSLEIAKAFNMGLKWGRLYGGCILVMLIDGQDLQTPLRLDAVGQGQFKGLLVLDRWMLNPDWSNPVEQYGPYIGRPTFYEVTAAMGGLPQGKIHFSRCIRFEGDELPYYQRLAENGWGMSVLESLWDRLLAFDSATLGAAQLAFKAYLRTLSVDGLRKSLVGPPAIKAEVVSSLEFIRKMQSQEGLTVIDAKDKFEAFTYSFAGLADVIDRLAAQVSGAMRIPLVRLMGEQPQGLNADSSGVIRVYNDMVKADQESDLRPGLARVLDVQHRSTFGRPPDKGFGFKFRSLWQLLPEEKATIATSTTAAVSQAFSSGIIDRPTALKELRESSEQTGIFTNITDDMIADAEANPPAAGMGGEGETPTGELPRPLSPQEQAQIEQMAQGSVEGGAEPANSNDVRDLEPSESQFLDKLAKSQATGDEAFDPALHPRGQPENKGEFAPKPGGGQSSGGGEPGAAASTPSGAPRALKADEHALLDKIIAGASTKVSAGDFIAARNRSKRMQFMSPITPSDLTNHALLTNSDRTVGLALSADGDVQNVFNNGGPKGASAEMISKAIAQGGRTLDCYDGFLPDYYRQLGFRETGRMKFNPEFAHDWDPAMGSPDVVFMAWKGYDRGDAKEAIARAGSRKEWIANERADRYETDWDQAKQRSRDEAAPKGNGPDGGGNGDNRGAGAEPGAKADAAGDQPGARAGEGAGGSLDEPDAKP